MKLRKLLKTDLEISEISFGCMSLGDNHTENARLLHKAYEGGINYFDTADLYQQGENEVSVGKALKGMRDKVFIATKVGNQLRADGSGKWDWNPTKEYILKAVHESLRRLQTDYIDLYQLHGGTIDDPIDETIEAFEILKQQGHIRYYGISSIRPNVIREYVQRADMVSVMMQYSLLDRRPEESCLQLLEENEIGVIVRGGIARGLLAGKEPQSYLNYSVEQVGKAAQKIKEITNGKSLSQVALQFVLAPKAIATVAAGIRTEAQLNDILGITKIPDLTSSEIEELRSVLPVTIYENHR